MEQRTKRILGTVLAAAFLGLLVAGGFHAGERIRLFLARESFMREGGNDVTAGFFPEHLRINGISAPEELDTEDLSFSWEIAGNEDHQQTAYEIQIDRNGQTVYDSGIVLSPQTVGIPMERGALSEYAAYFWRVLSFDEDHVCHGSAWEPFSVGCLTGDPFSQAKMIAVQEGEEEEGEAIFFSTFSNAQKEIDRAVMAVSALGVYEAYLDGARIGEDEFAPGWTDYRQTLLYQTYDVTEAMTASDSHCLAVMLGKGWWAGKNGFDTYGEHDPGLIAALRIEYADGTTDWIGTDENWTYIKDTMIRSADFFDGEVWDGSKADAAGLSAALCRDPNAERLLSGTEIPSRRSCREDGDFTGKFARYAGAPVKKIRERSCFPVELQILDGTEENGTDYGAVTGREVPVLLTQDGAFTDPVLLNPGETLICDLGQNMAGVPSISAEVPEGCRLTLGFGEMRNDSGDASRGDDGPEGSLYHGSYREALCEVSLTAGAEGRIDYESSFFFTGFRYLSVKAEEPVRIEAVCGVPVSNSSRTTGELTTDHEKLNRLYANILWSQYNNFSLIASDCPQRNERLGWLGDLNAFAGTSLYDQDLYAFYQKWLRDIREAQLPNGAYPDTVPAVKVTGAASAGWAEAGIFVPWQIYRIYGDPDVLSDQYRSMEQYMVFLRDTSHLDGSGTVGPGPIYGDWLSAEETDPAFLAALWYGADARAMRHITEILLADPDAREALALTDAHAAYYTNLFDEINAYIRKTYLTEDLQHVSGRPLSQTELSFLLHEGFLRDKEIEQAKKLLRESIEEADCRVMTGLSGTPVLLETLSETGQEDLVYRMLFQEEPDSWMYEIDQGATTLWEHFDSYTEEDGFQKDSMNSFDHFHEGCIGQWMYKKMLGISVDHDRDPVITVAPVLPKGEIPLHSVSGSFDSIYGKIAVSWEKEGERAAFHVSIPTNAKALVDLPIAGFEEKILPGGSYEFSGVME